VPVASSTTWPTKLPPAAFVAAVQAGTSAPGLKTATNVVAGGWAASADPAVPSAARTMSPTHSFLIAAPLSFKIDQTLPGCDESLATPPLPSVGRA